MMYMNQLKEPWWYKSSCKLTGPFHLLEVPEGTESTVPGIAGNDKYLLNWSGGKLL